MIGVRDLSKIYRVYKKDPGIVGSFKSLLKRRYESVVALDSVSFSIAAGEIVALLGPNGAGKSTTLKVLSGLLYPTSGSVMVNGYRPIARRHEFLKSVTLIMGHKQQLIWDLSAQDTFLVHKAVYEVQENEFARHLKLLTEMLELGDVLDVPVRKLSFGQRMRCELACSLIHRPTILFLDEPTIGLDTSMQVIVRQFLLDYAKHMKATVVITSHNMADIEAIAGRIILINSGKKVFDGKTKEFSQLYGTEKKVKVEFFDAPSRHELNSLELENLDLQVNEDDPSCIHLTLSRAGVPQVISRILQHANVRDITIEEIGMDEAVRRAYVASGTRIGL